MSQRVPSLTPNETHPFANAEEAWFWYLACHEAKLEGARVVAGRGAIARPCDPQDIYLAAARLLDGGHLRPHHLRVMIRYGRAMLPPDPDRPHHQLDLLHWREAMSRLGGALKARGIMM